MADFNSAYHKFCPVEVNGSPGVRNSALPPIYNTQLATATSIFSGIATGSACSPPNIISSSA